MATSSAHQDIARRYAGAFFALVEEQGQMDQAQNDMTALKSFLVEGGDEADSFFNNATLTRVAQAEAILAIAKRMDLSKLTGQLLGTLASKRRLGILSTVVEQIDAMIDDKRGIVTADVTAAQALDQKQVDAIQSSLKKVLGKDVRVNLRLDAEIAGGLIVRVGSRLIDSSVRTKLERMHRALKSNTNTSDKAKMKEVA